MSFRVKYWGVRGSLPTSPSPQLWTQHFEQLMTGFFSSGRTKESEIASYLESLGDTNIGGYGTATTCADIRTDRGHIIIDGGSGIKHLGDFLMKKGEGRGPFHIFLTHFHWDHLLGLPFFTPHFIPGTKINYYAVQPELENIVRSQFKKPNFPVQFDDLRSEIKFHRLEARKPIQIDDLTVTPYLLDHPDPSWGFRVESQGKAYAHCVDTECTRQSREALGLDLPLYQNADLMYFDAQYTLPELAEKANWGHSAAEIGLDISYRENIKNVVFAHHDPGASIEQIQALEAQARDYVEYRRQNEGIPQPVNWSFAHEGLEIDLTKL